MRYIFPWMGCPCLKGMHSWWQISEDPGITSQSQKLVCASSSPQQNFCEKSLTQKDGGSFILVSLNNRRHQVYFRNLCGPCLVIFLYYETGWQLLNVHISYKTPSYWRTLILYGVPPKQFICLKRFQGLDRHRWGSAIRVKLFKGVFFLKVYL